MRWVETTHFEIIFHVNRGFYLFYIGVWCNGNTADFGSVIMGSTPVTSTIIDNHGRDINAPNGLVGDAVS